MWGKCFSVVGMFMRNSFFFFLVRFELRCAWGVLGVCLGCALGWILVVIRARKCKNGKFFLRASRN